jgi:hypothetical protein
MVDLLGELPDDEQEALLASLQRAPAERAAAQEISARTPLPLPAQGGSGVRVTVRRVTVL